MTYTVKITRRRGEAVEPDSPEATLGGYKETEITDFFFPADTVAAHGYSDGEPLIPTEYKSWSTPPEAYFRDSYAKDGVERYQHCRLIEFTHNGETRWVLASNCWLMGPDGRTVERLA